MVNVPVVSLTVLVEGNVTAKDMYIFDINTEVPKAFRSNCQLSQS